jgi:hypothetical protein
MNLDVSNDPTGSLTMGLIVFLFGTLGALFPSRFIVWPWKIPRPVLGVILLFFRIGGGVTALFGLRLFSASSWFLLTHR